MSLLAVLRKSGEMLASYDVPNHANDLPSLHESMKILQQEINQTLSSLLEGDAEGSNESGEDEIDDDSDDDDESAAVNGNKRKLSQSTNSKKLKTS